MKLLGILAMDKFRNKLLATTLASGLSIAPAFQAYANSNAQDVEPNEIELLNPDENNNVGIANLREDKDGNKIDVRTAQTIAGMRSKGAIVILYMGDELEKANKVIAGAQLAKDKGIKIRGVALAHSDPLWAKENPGKTDNFLIYAGGFLAVTRGLDPDNFTEKEIAHLLQGIQNEYSQDLVLGKG